MDQHLIVETRVGEVFQDFDLDRCFVLAVAWLALERRDYQPGKFNYEEEARILKEQGVTEGSRWDTQLMTYLGRINALGLDTPGGMQACAKFAATAVALFEGAIREFGMPPAPGFASGELGVWDAAK